MKMMGEDAMLKSVGNRICPFVLCDSLGFHVYVGFPRGRING